MKYHTKYTCKKKFLISYLALLCIGILLTILRWISVFNDGVVVVHPEVNSHISNLSLSMIVYLGIGHSWLLSGVKFRFIVILGALLLGANILCETLLGFLNTTDIVDAIYGAAGLAVSFVHLSATNKCGLLPIGSRDSPLKILFGRIMQ